MCLLICITVQTIFLHHEKVQVKQLRLEKGVALLKVICRHCFLEINFAPAFSMGLSHLPSPAGSLPHPDEGHLLS